MESFQVLLCNVKEGKTCVATPICLYIIIRSANSFQNGPRATLAAFSGSIFSVLLTPTQPCQSKLLKTDDAAIINAKCLTVFGFAISLGCCSFEFSVAPALLGRRTPRPLRLGFRPLSKSAPKKSSGLIQDNYWDSNQMRKVVTDTLAKHEHKQHEPCRSAHQGHRLTDNGLSSRLECWCRAREYFSTCSLQAEPHRQFETLHHPTLKKPCWVISIAPARLSKKEKKKKANLSGIHVVSNIFLKLVTDLCLRRKKVMDVVGDGGREGERDDNAAGTSAAFLELSCGKGNYRHCSLYIFAG